MNDSTDRSTRQWPSPASARLQRLAQPAWRLLGAAAVALLSACATPAADGRVASTTQLCTVTRVSDGDSLQARCPGPGAQAPLRIRIRAIDAPELRQRYGQAARQAVLRLCMNQPIHIPARPELDRYGRALVDVQCRQTDVASHLVRAGLAWTYRPTASEYPHLTAAEQQAKRAGRGLWGDANPVPPWTWRRSHSP